MDIKDLCLKLGQARNEPLADPKVDAVVITHGTDTLEETAYFPKPRHQERQACDFWPCALCVPQQPFPQRDLPMNLLEAVRVLSFYAWKPRQRRDDCHE